MAMSGRAFSTSGNFTMMVEEFLTGPEVSVLESTQTGRRWCPWCQHGSKRALDGDRGLNTGGMGTIAPNPCYTPELAQACTCHHFPATIEAMRAEGCRSGAVCTGLMLTPDGRR